MNVDDNVMVVSGPYALKHGQIVDVPVGLEHPLVQVRFFGASGKLLESKTDLVNVRRLVNFGKTERWLTPLQRAREEKACS